MKGQRQRLFVEHDVYRYDGFYVGLRDTGRPKILDPDDYTVLNRRFYVDADVDSISTESCFRSSDLEEIGWTGETKFRGKNKRRYLRKYFGSWDEAVAEFGKLCLPRFELEIRGIELGEGWTRQFSSEDLRRIFILMVCKEAWYYQGRKGCWPRQDYYGYFLE